jgi:hypothetical protein
MRLEYDDSIPLLDFGSKRMVPSDVDAAGNSEGARKGWESGSRPRALKKEEEIPIRAIVSPKGVAYGAVNNMHDEIARDLGFQDSRDAMRKGWVRVQGFSMDTGVQVNLEQFENSEKGRRLIRDIIQRLPVTVDRVAVEHWTPDHKFKVMDVDEARKVYAASEQSLGGKYKGTLWNGINLIGFSGPEEEVLRAQLSRIPPELLSYVNCIRSAKELNAKHGRYAGGTILYNPSNLTLLQHFGGGELPIPHSDLTLVHEVGHSLYDNLSPEEVKAWQTISGWMEGTKEGQAPPYEERRPGWEPQTSKWTHVAGAKFPRYYAEKNPNEDFADCFAFFLLNKAYRIGDAKKAFFDSYIKHHVNRYPQASIQSPVVRAGGNHEIDFEQREYPEAFEQWESNRHSNGKDIRSSQHRLTQYERVDRRIQRNNIAAYGTSEGAIKGWDTRGRGRHPHPKADYYKQKFEEQELGIKPTPEPPVVYPEDLHPQTPFNYGYKEPKTKAKPYEKMKEKFEKFQTGQSNKTAVLGGIWPSGSAPVHIYKMMLTGDWFTTSKIIQNMDPTVLKRWAERQQKGASWGVVDNVISGIKRVQKAGQMFGQWTIEQQTNSKGEKEYRLVMNLVHDQARGQVGVTPELQHDALTVIQKMINNKGLDKTVSKEATNEYLKSVGLKDVDLLAKSVSSWTASPNGSSAQYLKRVAADYYGNNWAKEWKGGTYGTGTDYAKDPSTFKYDELKKQAMAIKALSNEYMKAAGIQYLYRGMSLSSKHMDAIKQAIKEGKPVPIPLNSLTGYSKSAAKASSSFGHSIVIRYKVNPEEVWVASGALPHMFHSFADEEKEYIVGSKSNTVVQFLPEDIYVKGMYGTDYKKPDWASKL